MATNKDPELVTIHNFDINKVNYSAPKTKPRKAANSSFTCGEVTYNGGAMYIVGLEQSCHGFWNKTDFSTGKIKEGEYQTAYPVRAYDRKEPNADEKKFMNIFAQMEKKLKDWIEEYATHECMPENAQDLNEKNKYVKTTITYPKKKDANNKPVKGKVFDLSAQGKIYADVYTNKKGGITPKFYGPNDVELEPLKDCFEQLGMMTPVFYVKHIFLDDKVASIKLALQEANFTPIVRSSSKRLLGKNTATQSIVAQDEEGEGGEAPSDTFDVDDLDDSVKETKKSSPKSKSQKEEVQSAPKKGLVKKVTKKKN